MANEELLNSNAAGDVLTELLPDKTSQQWAMWLRNNRNQSRSAPYRVPHHRFSGGSFYIHEDLMKFVEWEKSRQLGTVKLTGRAAEVMQAFGIGEAGGSNYGRKLACSVMLAFEEDSPSKQFVRVTIEKPLAVFRLEVDEATALAKELLEAVRAIERHKKPQTQTELDETMRVYEVQSKSKDMTVRRLKEPK